MDPLVSLGLGLDAPTVMTAAGLPPDPWQADLLRTRPRRALLVCSRQSGKSTTVAALCLHTAVARGADVVIVAPSQRQASELLRRVKVLAGGLGLRLDRSAATVLELAEGGRITALPGTPDSVRGYTASLLCLEEAAFLRPETIEAASPIIATVPDAAQVAISTPNGRRGWFHDQWTNGGDWHRVLVTADDCPRITPEFLATERASMPAARFEAEYYGSFAEVTGGFLAEDLARVFGAADAADTAPVCIGADVGRSRDNAALVAVTPGAAGLEVAAVDRVPLNTGYAEVSNRVVAAMDRHGQTHRPYAAIDATGVGAPVVEMTRTALLGAEDDVAGVTWTGGKSLGGAWPDVTVPKPVLMDAVRTRMEQGRLSCPPAVPGAAELAADAAAYAPGAHVGDTLAAAAMAVWLHDHLAATARRLDHAA